MRVLCTLPNAGELINGVAFQATSVGMLSDPIDTDMAANFLRIPGYVEVLDPPTRDDGTPDLTMAPTPATAPRRGRPPRS